MRTYIPEAHNQLFYAALDDIAEVPETAKKYSYTERTIRKWCDCGYIAAVKLNRRWILSETSLQIFLKKTNRSRMTE